MEVRRVQEMGGGTLLISLPKDWAKKNRITKGSIVAIERGLRENLIIYPITGEEKETREVEIPYPAEYMARLINSVTGAYLLGFDVIRIRAKKRITYDDRELIKKAIRQLVGLEIVEEDAMSITAQFLPDPSNLDPEKVFRRMHMITKGMLRDAIAALIESDFHLLRIVSERDDEVDRLYFLLVRLIRSAVQDARLAARFHLSPVDCLDYRVAANLVESIGDACVEIAKVASDIIQNGVDEEMKDVLSSTSELLERIQDVSIRAFLTRGADEAKEVFDVFKALSTQLDRLEGFKSKSQRLSSLLPSLTSWMGRVARYSIDITDLAIPMYPMLR